MTTPEEGRSLTLRSLVALGGVAAPSTLAEVTGLSARSLRRRLAELRAAGIVTGGQRSVILTEKGRAQAGAPRGECPGAPGWDPPGEKRRPLLLDERCQSCGSELLASTRGTTRICPGTARRPGCGVVEPAAVRLPYERAAVRRVASDDERDRTEIDLELHRGQLLARLGRLEDVSLELEALWRHLERRVRRARSHEALERLSGQLVSLGAGRPGEAGLVIDVEAVEETPAALPGLGEAGDTARRLLVELGRRTPRPAEEDASSAYRRPCAALRVGCPEAAVAALDTPAPSPGLLGVLGCGLPVDVCGEHLRQLLDEIAPELAWSVVERYEGAS